MGVIIRAGVFILMKTLIFSSASAQDLLPYEAQYTLSLAESEHAQPEHVEVSISDIRGELTMQLSQQCGSMRLRQAVAVRIFFDDNDDIDLALTFDIVEHDNGNFARSMLLVIDGEEPDQTFLAERNADGSLGVVVESEGKSKTIDFPTGTLLPIAYQRQVMLAMKNGRSRYEATVFDGITPEPLLMVTTIGKPRQYDLNIPHRLIPDRKGWPMRTAHFKAQQVLPTYEESVVMTDAGLLLEFGIGLDDLSLRADLTQAKSLSKPAC